VKTIFLSKYKIRTENGNLMYQGTLICSRLAVKNDISMEILFLKNLKIKLLVILLCSFIILYNYLGILKYI